jgi:hypothetical protein
MKYIYPKISAGVVHTGHLCSLCLWFVLLYIVHIAICSSTLFARTPVCVSILIAIAIIHVPRLYTNLRFAHDVRPIHVLVIPVEQRRRVSSKTLF